MKYPDLDPGVGTQRHQRAVTQLRVGDIVDCWLDCEPDAGHTLPLPIVIVRVPALRESNFLAKDIFGGEPYPMRFHYAWKIVGHVNGLAELLGVEELERVNRETQPPNLSDFATEARP